MPGDHTVEVGKESYELIVRLEPEIHIRIQITKKGNKLIEQTKGYDFQTEALSENRFQSHLATRCFDFAPELKNEN